MIKNQKFKLVMGTLVITTLLVNCKKEKANEIINSGVSSANQKIGYSGIEVERDYLYFKSLSAFNRTMSQMATATEVEKDEFEGEFNGFKSLRKTYNEHTAADSVFFNNLEVSGYPASNPDQIEHCPLIMNNMNLYDKRPISQVFNDYLLIPRINNAYTPLMNASGLLRIGDSLIYCTRDTIKIMSPANTANIGILTHAVSETNGITFVNKIGAIGAGNIVLGSESCVRPPYFNQYPWAGVNLIDQVTFSTSGKLCLRIEMSFKIDTFTIASCPAYYQGSFTGGIYTKKRNYLGIWVYDACTVTLELYYSTNLTAPYMPAQGNIFSGNCNGSLAIDENLSGHTVFPVIKGADYPVSLNVTSFHARATRTGGSAGAEVNVYH